MVGSSKYKDLPCWEIRGFELGLTDIAVFARKHAQVEKGTCNLRKFVPHNGTRETYLKLVYYLSNITKCYEQRINEKKALFSNFVGVIDGNEDDDENVDDWW